MSLCLLPLVVDVALRVSLQAEYLGQNKVRLAWRVSSGLEDDVDMYEVQYGVSGGSASNLSNILTKTTSITFDPLPANTEYQFRVRARSDNTWSRFSDPVTAFTHGDPTMESQAPVAQIGMIAGITIALILCVVLFGVVSYLCWRRNSDTCGRKQASDCDTLEYRHAEMPPFDHHLPHMLHPMGMGTPIYRSGLPMPRTYVDPHT